MRFRKAQQKDHEKLIRLIDQLGYQIDANRLKANLKFYGSKAIVLEEGGQVIGCLAYQILPVFHSSEKHMRIISLVIEERYRGQGMGKKLMKEAEKIGRKNGCSVIELTSAYHRIDTHKFYIKQGYELGGEKLYFRKEVIT